MEPKYLTIRLLSIMMFCIIMRLIYGSKLKTGSSWMWLVFGVGFLFLTLWPGAIDLCMKFAKVDSWIEIVFFFMLISLLIISIHFSTVIAGLTDRSKDLAQEIAFLNREIERNKEIRSQIHADTYE